MGQRVHLLLVLLLAVSVIGCGVGVSAYEKPGAPRDNSAANKPDRMDCGAILGSAFRSATERDWYNGNCSHWPLTNYGASGATGPAVQLPPGCAEQQGKPYTSEENRRWFLNTCAGPVAEAQKQAQPAGQPVPPGQPPATVDPAQASVQPAAEAPAAPATAPAPMPDRHDCNSIRGGAYNSETERQWYLANCSAPAPPRYTTAAPTPVSPAPRLPGGQLPAQAYTIQPSTLCGLPIGAVDLSLQALHRQICGGN